MISPARSIANTFKFSIFACLLWLTGGQPSAAQVECVVLDEQNWDQFAPAGKEVDAIYGDIVLRNERIIAVIANPSPKRNANLTVRKVGGCLIDLTIRSEPNDQLSCFYPGSDRVAFNQGIESVQFSIAATENPNAATKPVGLNELPCRSDEFVEITITGKTTQQNHLATVTYRLAAESEYLEVVSNVTNQSDSAVAFSLPDMIRADNTFTKRLDRENQLFSFYDPWFYQAYGVLAAGDFAKIAFNPKQRSRNLSWNYRSADATSADAPQKILPGGSLTWKRRVIPARNGFELELIAARIQSKNPAKTTIVVKDATGPVKDAKVVILQAGQELGFVRTDQTGKFDALLNEGQYQLSVSADGRQPVEKSIEVPANGLALVEIPMSSLGVIVGKITDGQGVPIPCKIAFHGVEETADPDFGPDSRAVAVKNLRYSENGSFAQPLGPGKYEVIVSHGPEYDAKVLPLEVIAGGVTELQASLVRSVDTTGWVSTEYHSHSSPSGDNTSDQLGRVLNLLAEHLEFAPCTEHQRVASYLPHLERLDAVGLMATCPGMELTGQPLPINHQNAFPMILRPRTQDGGGPTISADPVVQIERLKYWDNNSEKLVQMNHPNLNSILGDQDNNGEADAGFGKMFSFVDVVEIHPLPSIFEKVDSLPPPGKRGNTIFNWMQLLNLGYRMPGVVNTDAHYNFHGSGWLRNFVASSTDDPAKIDTMEMVRNSAAGKIVMSNGPFLTAVVRGKSLSSGTPAAAGVGEEIKLARETVEIDVTVQCPNWFDINRVQVIVNGRMPENLNFTRRSNAAMFENGVMKFNQTIQVPLQEDAHLIVVAAGEGLQLGRVMGPKEGETMPIAVTNPIFVDVDGDGFEANGDRLGAPILMPVKQ